MKAQPHPVDSIPRDAQIDDLLDTVWRYYPRFGQLHDYVIRNIARPVRLNEAARLMRLQPTYFSGLFRETVGVTFTSWVRECRIAEAKRILAQQHVHISAAAYRVGYTDLTTFERAFKRVAGVTPSEFRRQHAPGRDSD